MTLRLTEEEFSELQRRRGRLSDSVVTGPGTDERPKRRKYGNRKTEVDGLMFDSRYEAQVYMELMARVRAGELKCVCRQVAFDLGGGPNARKESRYRYIADFVTIDRENHVEVLDAKSEITRKNRTYINKKKQMASEWGIVIREV